MQLSEVFPTFMLKTMISNYVKKIVVSFIAKYTHVLQKKYKRTSNTSSKPGFCHRK